MNAPIVYPSERPRAERTSISAVMSLILGLSTLPGIFCCVGYGTGIISIVLGAIALVQVSNGEANPASKVMAIVGIVTSSLAIVGYTIALMVGIASAPTVPQDLEEVGIESPAGEPVAASDEKAMRVRAVKLVDAYESNELAAEKKYEGKMVKVSGIIGDIKKDVLDKPYVTLGSSKKIERKVQCFLADGVDATKLEKGDKITMTGRVDQLMINVIVTECR